MLDAIRIKQLREAVPEKRIVELQDVGPKRHQISCIPLTAGEHFTTVIEINPNLQFDRIISVPYSEIAVIAPHHSYIDFYEWTLADHGAQVPDEYPIGDSHRAILEQIRNMGEVGSVWKRDGAIYIGPILEVGEDRVRVREIDCLGDYIWEIEAAFEDIYRIDCGGVRPRALWKHAEAHANPNSEQDGGGRPAPRPESKCPS